MGSIAGSLIRGDTRPKVPPLQKIDAGGEQELAVKNNLNILPQAENLVSQANAFTQEQITKMLRASIPNYDELVRNTSENIGSMVRGELPQDVQNMIQLSDAAKSLSGGYAGTGMHGALFARDLGLNSLNLIQGGIDTASRWLQSMDALFSPGMINVSNMFLTPQQQMAHDVSERDKAWNVQWLRNQIKAQPNQYQEAFATLFDNIEQTGRSILTSYAGGAVGGGGGGGGGAGWSSNVPKGDYGYSSFYKSGTGTTYVPSNSGYSPF